MSRRLLLLAHTMAPTTSNTATCALHGSYSMNCTPLCPLVAEREPERAAGFDNSDADPDVVVVDVDPQGASAADPDATHAAGEHDETP